MNFKIRITISIIILTLFFPFSGDAKPLTRREASKVIREGEYSTKGKRTKKVASKKKKATRHVASNKKHKNSKRKKKKPAKRTKHAAKKAKKSRTKKHASGRARHRNSQLPYAKETPNEMDMPFISVPESRVSEESSEVVMEDPGKPGSLVPAIVPESENDPNDPGEVAREPASSDAERDPASTTTQPVSSAEADAAAFVPPAAVSPAAPVREPETFDTSR